MEDRQKKMEEKKKTNTDKKKFKEDEDLRKKEADDAERKQKLMELAFRKPVSEPRPTHSETLRQTKVYVIFFILN